jgi:hypothetical protein
MESTMKRIACLLIAAWLTAPAFAADDRCSANLQQINDDKATKITVGDPMTTQIEMLEQQAQEAQSAGDTEGCIASSERALQMLDSANRQGSGEGSGSGGANGGTGGGAGGGAGQ